MPMLGARGVGGRWVCKSLPSRRGRHRRKHKPLRQLLLPRNPPDSLPKIHPLPLPLPALLPVLLEARDVELVEMVRRRRRVDRRYESCDLAAYARCSSSTTVGIRKKEEPESGTSGSGEAGERTKGKTFFESFSRRRCLQDYICWFPASFGYLTAES